MSKLSPHLQAPDLFGDLPGVGEVAARYAGSSRAVTSTASLRARAEAGGLVALNDAEAL